MALTKFEVASSALIMVGANAVTTFSNAVNASTEQKVCYHLWQSCIDHWLSLHSWRFATKTVQMSRLASTPTTLWKAAYQQPADMKAMQAIRLNESGNDTPYDRFENQILCNATDTDKVYCVFTYEPPIQWWPGYFIQLIELGFAHKLSFALTGKLDLRSGLEESTEVQFRVAKNADSKQQTTRRLKVAGRRSILEARRA